MDRRPDPGLARLQRYALAVWCWRARSRIACSPTKYAKPQWASRCRSDSGRAADARRMGGTLQRPYVAATSGAAVLAACRKLNAVRVDSFITKCAIESGLY